MARSGNSAGSVKTAMKTAIHELRQMPPEQRGPAVDSEKYRAAFSDQENANFLSVWCSALAPVHAPKRLGQPDHSDVE